MPRLPIAALKKLIPGKTSAEIAVDYATQKATQRKIDDVINAGGQKPLQAFRVPVVSGTASPDVVSPAEAARVKGLVKGATQAGDQARVKDILQAGSQPSSVVFKEMPPPILSGELTVDSLRKSIGSNRAEVVKELTNAGVTKTDVLLLNDVINGVVAPKAAKPLFDRLGITIKESTEKLKGDVSGN